MVAFTSHHTVKWLTLYIYLDVVIYLNNYLTNQQINKIKFRGDKMAENKIQDYFDDNDDGHVDTREANFKCENPDKHLGCDLYIDVMG